MMAVLQAFVLWDSYVGMVLVIVWAIAAGLETSKGGPFATTNNGTVNITFLFTNLNKQANVRLTHCCSSELANPFIFLNIPSIALWQPFC